jgi:hypothetical protein
MEMENGGEEEEEGKGKSSQRLEDGPEESMWEGRSSLEGVVAHVLF